MVMLALMVSFSVSAQVSISGTVTDNTDFGLPGVSVVVQGTTIGVLTNMDGTYTIEVPSTSSVLSFSFIGYVTQEVAVGNQTTINVVLAEDIQQLDEVVVVGYGTQAKKDITGSVSVVTAESLAESASVTFASALQGKSSGVYVSTTGAPGAESTIRVRGFGSVNGSDPLVIVDGISGADIASVNSNDIESFQVLKDASATAIYGAQGANGVIIVTTKQGTKSGQPRISYNGYVGISTMANNGFDQLDAWELMEFYAEGMVNTRDIKGLDPGANSQFGALDANDQLTMPYATNPAGYSEQMIIDDFGSIAAWEASYLPDGAHSWARSAYSQMLLDGSSEAEARAGSDWYSLVVQNGLIQDHQISAIGGNDKGQYSMSLSYTGQEGTIKSSYYDRYSLRINTTFNPRKHISLGQNSNVTFTEYGGERGSQGDGGVFGQTYTTKPWVPVYNVGGDFGGTISNEGGRTQSPVATTTNQIGDWDRDFRVQNSIFAEIKPIPELTLKSQVATNVNVGWGITFSEITAMHNKEGSTRNSFREDASYGFSLQWTNTATYTKSFDDHDLTVVVGSEALNQGLGRDISATRNDYTMADDPNTWTVDNGSAADPTNSGGVENHTTMFGYFGRADYSYQGKYLATVTVRRDASSKFGINNRWGTFPSGSIGWRISDEAFMDGTSGWLDDLKLRAGYGTTGNSNIGAYNWAFSYDTGTSYHYSINGDDNAASTGYGVSSLGDPEAKWETTRMLNAGFDATLLDNRLTIGFDYYVKRTTDMLVAANWSALAGRADKPDVNIGDMANNGIDINIGWNDKIGDFSYGLTANISQYKNEVIKLGSSDLYTSTRITNITITTPGQPIGMYYGYNVLGIYTSVDDVLNHTTNGTTILPYGVAELGDLNPTDFVGRYKFEDVNQDGAINDDDCSIIGNPHPDFTGGLNLTAGYKNFDLSGYLYFSVGNDLYKHYMFYTHYGALASNYSNDRRDNSWSPDNPDGIYPMWFGSANEAKETTSTSNSLYIEDGSYARLQTLSLGYNIPKSLQDKIGTSKFRIYGQISNLFTITKYPGLDPEVQGDDMRKGVDYGAYGMPRQFICGVNVTF